MVINMEARLSMLDVLKNGLQSSGRTTYVHRMLYVGEHKLGRVGLEEFMKDLVPAQTDQSREEALTGFLLVYHKHFIHLVEGSTSTLTRHLRSLVQSDSESSSQIGRVKVIVEITHISKRCTSSWTSRSATPPTLASQLKPGAPVAETAHHVDAVLGKMMRLMDTLKKLPPGAPIGSQTALRLPEAEVLDALLSSALIKDVRVLLEEQRVPPRITLYDDVVWPMQSDFVPYNLLQQPIEALESGAQQNGDHDEDRDEDEDGVDQEGMPGLEGISPEMSVTREGSEGREGQEE